MSVCQRLRCTSSSKVSFVSFRAGAGVGAFVSDLRKASSHSGAVDASSSLTLGISKLIMATEMLPADIACSKEAKEVIVDCCVGRSASIPSWTSSKFGY
jgi:hypothetical protein